MKLGERYIRVGSLVSRAIEALEARGPLTPIELKRELLKITDSKAQERRLRNNLIESGYLKVSVEVTEAARTARRIE